MKEETKVDTIQLDIIYTTHQKLEVSKRVMHYYSLLIENGNEGSGTKCKGWTGMPVSSARPALSLAGEGGRCRGGSGRACECKEVHMVRVPLLSMPDV